MGTVNRVRCPVCGWCRTWARFGGDYEAALLVQELGGRGRASPAEVRPLPIDYAIALRDHMRRRLRELEEAIGDAGDE